MVLRLLACMALVLCLSVNAGRGEDEKAAQFQLVAPAELAELRKQAKAGLDERSKDTIRQLYTASALQGVLAHPTTAPKDITANVQLAKAYGYAMMDAQRQDDKKRETRKQQKAE